MTMQLDDSWEHQGGPMYYRSPRRWICVYCDYDTTSPYGASCHAAIHGITLPNARKKESVKKPEIQAQIEPKKEEKSQITHKGKNSIFDVIGRNQNSRPQYSNSIEAPKQETSEFTNKLLQLMQFKQTNLFTDAELEEIKAQLGLPHGEDPKIKMEKQQTRDWWMVYIVNEQDPQKQNRMMWMYYYLIQSGQL